TTYYWRVGPDNGSLGRDSGRIWDFRTMDEPMKNDVTFFVCSDTHYGRSDNKRLNEETIDMMNAVPGMQLPSEAGGGIVRTPRGVIVNGDLLDEPNGVRGKGNWDDFVKDYGLDGSDGRLGFPAYEGFGNHDVEGRPDRETPPGGYTRWGIRERNRLRKGITELSPDSLHYSWDWDDVHLVQLNLFGGDGPEDVMHVDARMHDPGKALEFLRKDLERYVGKSRRKVVIFQHIGWVDGMSDWWTPEAKQRFYDVVKGYNIVALINGHSHGAGFYYWQGLLTIHDGATARPESGKGDFMIVRLADNELTVVQRKREGWGIIFHKKLSD
ncbi:MAG TPA: metallophosphoesterase, partial [Puia sp.]|nr:metallophosphoesterase [Puia sp.]